MSPIPKNIVNKALYDRVKSEITARVPKSSAYRSMQIINEYKKRGGEIKGSAESGRLKRWLKEEWVQVEPYLKGKKVKCGAGEKKPKACRPTKRVDSRTPITIQEVRKLHKDSSILRAVRRKKRDMDQKIIWKTLSVG